MEIGQENLYVDIRPWRAKLTQQIDQENNSTEGTVILIWNMLVKQRR